MNTEREISESRISLNEFEQLIDSQQSVLLNHAYYIVGSMPDAEDIVQESFVKFYRKSSHLRDGAKAKAYLYRMVNHASIDFIRLNRNRRTISLDKIANLPDQQVNGSGQKDLQNEFHNINNILKQIPDEQSEVIRMRTISDLSFVEISQILKIHVSTVKSRFKYGIDKLKTGIKKEVYHEM